MLASKRQAHILELVEAENGVSIRDLCERLPFTRETIRKDIGLLSRRDKLRQVRGGAVRVQSSEPPIEARHVVNRPGKGAIAAHVARALPDGTSLIIDSGSTTQMAAQALALAHTKLRVITNDLDVARILSGSARELVVLGGRLSEGELSTHGLEAIQMLARYRAEFALIGVGGLSAEALFTDFSREAAMLREAMISQSQTPCLLVDETKFGVIGQAQLGHLTSRARVITDAAPPDNIAHALERIGIKFDVADRVQGH